MKVTGFEILRVPPSWVWLRILTDTELVGLGEPYLEGQPEAVISEVRRLESIVVGQDPLDRARLWQRMYDSGMGYRGGPVTMSAISGIDMGLWDLAGKAHGMSIASLLGGHMRKSVRMYRAAGPWLPAFPTPGQAYGEVSTAARDDRDGWSRGIEASAELGFTALKVHVKPPHSVTSTTREVDRIIERFAWARETVGSDVDLALDVHDPPAVISAQIAAGVAAYRPLFVEEPVAQENVSSLNRITNASTVPIAAGERWVGRWAFLAALTAAHLDVIQPDLAHAGGLTELQRIEAISSTFGASIAPHCPLSPIALTATLQFDAYAPSFLVQEHNEVNGTLDRAGRYRVGAGYLAEPFTLSDGAFDVPESAGLGVALDERGLDDILRRSWSVERG
ncbi:enolase C-terminal domain-like protein [Microbacterium sp. NPDC056234]|uniref:enolase C-terminal domain-like protein n=1 Tax=Microbacterium sp. NPDC056234 TaxID=3345757 RepID=UPI0035D5E732